MLVLRTTSGAPAAARNLLGKRQGSPHNGYEITVLTDGAPYVRCDAGPNDAASALATDVTDNAWHTLAFTYKPVARTFQLATEQTAGLATITPGNCASSVSLTLGDARLPGAAVEVALLAICTGAVVESASAADLAVAIHHAVVEEP